jgi:hypothetical protein
MTFDDKRDMYFSYLSVGFHRLEVANQCGRRANCCVAAVAMAPSEVAYFQCSEPDGYI